MVGAALVAAGGALGIRRALVRAGIVVQIAGACVLAAGASWVLAAGQRVGAQFTNAFTPAFGLDGLSAFFVAVIALTAIPALLTAYDALPESRTGPAVTALSGGFLLALVGVVAARDVTSFLAFWELMTLVPAIAILVARRDAAVRNAVFVYLAIAHLGGAGVWVSMLLLAHYGAIGGVVPATAPSAFIMLTALVGFGTKAGLMPLHAWLPRAHPVAPSHISALMSGVMIKVALYGLIRVLFEWTAPAPLWVGVLLLAVGGLSAVAGVLYALVQHELKRLLAFSSIENVGIIALGLGASIALRASGAELWSAIAFAAALLHTANHAAFKSLLFLGAGAFGHAVGALELDRIGGLLRRMPWTGWTFLLGSAAIAGVPPMNGFASEWLILQSLLHVGYADAAGVSFAGALAAAALAATAALAVFCFVKVVGLVLLGAPRTPAAAAAVDPPASSRLAMVLLAVSCVGLGVTPGLLVPTLVGLAPGSAQLDSGLSLALPGTGSLRPLVLLVTLVILVDVVRRVSSRGGRTAMSPAWTCGQVIVPRLQWTSAGFTKPLRLVLETVLRPRRELRIEEDAGLVREVRYRLEVPHLFDTVLYGPTQRAAMRLAARARRLQSGSLRAYITYLLALVFVMLALVQLGVGT